MDQILHWGIEIVLWFQTFSPALDGVFIALSFTGNELFYLLFLPLIIWCISPGFGIRLMMLFLISTYVNVFTKLIVDQPRPFQFDSRVIAIEPAADGGLPSAHTQNAVIFWAYLATIMKNRLFWIVASLMIILVPLSRLYLGVHFPTDLFAGYLLGFLILWIFLKLQQPCISWLQEKQLSLQLLLSVLIPILLLTMIPVMNQDLISVCGALLGGLSGLTLEHHWLKYKSPESLW